ncbi:putative MFS transporter [Hypoxylon crocopeplum]|nr:putative MFS transporter [Hypoxylon crocopeplum]
MAQSSTRSIELQQDPVRPAPTNVSSTEADVYSSSLRYSAGLHDGQRVLGETGGTERDFASRSEALQTWNGSSANLAKTLAIFLCFLIMGANDAAYGPLLPYLMRFYDVTHTIVSLIFLSPFIGYVGSAVLNNWTHLRAGQRGIAILCSSCHLVAYIIISQHPPFFVLVAAFILAGFANGLANAAWNSWMGSLANASELLGFMHSFYGLGGVSSPPIATAFITQLHLPWYKFYYVMIGLASVEVATLVFAFWSETSVVYKELHRVNEVEREANLTGALCRMPAARVAWTCAAFLLGYAGIEVALGGWIVLFMIEVRNGEAFASGMSAMGFWLGITVGRAVLGFVTVRFGIKTMTSSYICAAIGLQLIFWLVPEFYVSVLAVALQGFFLGPLYPSIVLVASKLLPRHQHVVVIGFAAAFGGCGAAVLPFLTGLLAEGVGVQVLQPVILALMVVLLAVWLVLPRMNKKRD